MGRLLDTVPGGFYSSNFRREHASEGHRIPGARRRSLNVHAESTPLVRLQSLTKTYREGERRQTVLRDVDLTLEAGAFVALFGRSGSGKSTLLNLISGIDLPTSGEVILGDVNLTALSERERTLFRRRNLGFVFQSFNLIPTLTVEENVMLPLELCGRGGGRAKAAAMLTEVGLGDRSRSFPDRLSGGNNNVWPSPVRSFTIRSWSSPTNPQVISTTKLDGR